MRQDLDIRQVLLEQCHGRTFQAVSAGSPPLPRAGQLCHGSEHPKAPRVLVAWPHPAPLTTPCPPQETCFSQIRAGLRVYHGSLATIRDLLPGHAGRVETLQLDMANLSSNIQQQVRGQRRTSWGRVGKAGAASQKRAGHGGGCTPGKGTQGPGGISRPGADATASAWLQMEDLGLATVTYPAENEDPLPTFSSRFRHQVGGFFILANFQRFLETAYRALRHLASL